MKKILGISLVALFAAAPMMAQASQVAFEGTLNQETNKYEVGANGQIATTSYVKGAYNALGEVINTKQDQLTAGGSNIQTAVVQSAAIHNTTTAGLEAASDSSLVTEKAVLTAIDASKSATQTLTNKTIDASSNTISNLGTGNFNADNIVVSAEGIAGSATASDDKLVTEKAVRGAIDTINSAATNLASTVASHTSAINLLNGSDSTEGSVAYAVAQEADARDTAITNKVNSLSATESQAAADSNGGLQLSITQQSGVITGISGSIAENTYDAYGAATSAVNGLNATKSQAADSTNGGLQLSVTQQSGVITAISGAIADGTYDEYGAATSAADAALQSAKNYTDAKILTVATTWGSDTATSTVHLENPGA